MIKEQIYSKTKTDYAVTETMVLMLIGFVLANTEISGLHSPINVALAGAMPPLYSTAVLVGSLVAYIITGQMGSALPIVFALVAVTSFKWSFPAKKASLFRGVSSALLMLVTGAAVYIGQGENGERIALHACLSVMCGVSAFFISELVYIRDMKIKIDGLKLYALCGAYVLFAATLCTMNFYTVNVGVAVGSCAVLVAAHKYRRLGGAVCGILTTCGAMLYSAEFGGRTIFLAMAGLSLTAFHGCNKLVTGAVFFSVNTIGLALMGFETDNFYILTEVLVGTVIFQFIPASLMLDNADDGAENSGLIHMARSRLGYAAESLTEVRESTDNITGMLEKKINRGDTVTEVSDKVCGKCRSRTECWQKNYERTNESFNILSRMNSVSMTHMPKELDHCLKRAELAEEFSFGIKQWKVNKLTLSHLKEAQKLMCEQMSLASDVLHSICTKISTGIHYDEAVTNKVRICLRVKGIPFESAVAYRNDARRLFIEIYCSRLHQVSGYTLYKKLSEEMSTSLECTKIYHKEEVRFLLREKAAYCVDYHSVQYGVESDEPSGDSSECFYDDCGNLYMVISDGMGTGRQAALDSRLAINLLRRLILGGIECKPAIRLINSIMMNKSSDESFATLDVAKIETDTGKLTLYKSGAAATIFRHNSSVLLVNSKSYPVGIIGDAEPFSKSFALRMNDIIVMFSDGIDEQCFIHIKKMLLNNELTIKEISNMIAEKAKEAENGAHGDDISVIVAKLSNN